MQRRHRRREPRAHAGAGAAGRLQRVGGLLLRQRRRGARDVLRLRERGHRRRRGHAALGRAGHPRRRVHARPPRGRGHRRLRRPAHGRGLLRVLRHGAELQRELPRRRHAPALHLRPRRGRGRPHDRRERPRRHVDVQRRRRRAQPRRQVRAPARGALRRLGGELPLGRAHGGRGPRHPLRLGGDGPRPRSTRPVPRRARRPRRRQAPDRRADARRRDDAAHGGWTPGEVRSPSRP